MIFLLCLLSVVFVILMLKLDCDITTWFYEKTGTNLHSFYSNKVVFDRCNFRYFLATKFVCTRYTTVFPKVVWVTGSSTGIGAALAVQAAKAIFIFYHLAEFISLF